MFINAENRVQNVLVLFDCVFDVITLENPGFYDNAHLLDLLGINVFNHRISAFADSTKGVGNTYGWKYNPFNFLSVENGQINKVHLLGYK